MKNNKNKKKFNSDSYLICLIILAELGDPYAQLKLGVKYLNGEVTAFDRRMTMDLLDHARVECDMYTRYTGIVLLEKNDQDNFNRYDSKAYLSNDKFFNNSLAYLYPLYNMEWPWAKENIRYDESTKLFVNAIEPVNPTEIDGVSFSPVEEITENSNALEDMNAVQVSISYLYLYAKDLLEDEVNTDNIEKAKEYFKKLAELGHDHSQFEYAKMLIKEVKNEL
ncbi:MAG: hypothetical protein LBF22_11125, partial [Deltaproteobacteria bacterium]|nr:hypothetical protein [Deltaproteobacteria bacterium]